MKKELKKTTAQFPCQKCGKDIGGKAYYILQLDCIYDGKNLSACDRLFVCTTCYQKLKSWLNLSQ